MIPPIPRAANLASCTTEAALLRMIGQGALPLLIVYHQSRRPICLPRRVVLGVLLRPRVCMELLDGVRTEVPSAHAPEMQVIHSGQPEPALECWPPTGPGRAA